VVRVGDPRLSAATAWEPLAGGGTRTLTVVALDTHQALPHLALPRGADVIKFDPGLGRA
jgi:hypothetical protein